MPILIGLSLAAYFTPAIVAMMRSHRQTLAIVLLNVFLGWTIVGWVVALVWAAANPPAPVVIYQPGQAPPAAQPDPGYMG